MPTIGKETSEFQITKSSTYFAYAALILAVVVAKGPELLGWVPNEGYWDEILAAVIGIAGVIQKLFIDLGYIDSRTLIKIKEEK